MTPCCTWRTAPTTPHWRSLPTTPLGRRGCGVGRCLRRQHLEDGIARYTPAQHRLPVFRMGQDPGLACRAFAAWTLWLPGYPSKPWPASTRPRRWGTRCASLQSGVCAGWAAFVFQLRRDVLAVHEQAEAAVVLSTEQGFTQWAVIGTSMRGWALAMQGQGEAGMAQVRQGIAAYRATGAALHVPYFCTLLADVCAHLGHTEDGLQARPRPTP